MKILEILSQHRNDFTATMECEACGHQRKLTSGYDDANYHDNVIPNMKCEKCGLSRRDHLQAIIDKGEAVTLNQEQIEILNHTRSRAAGGRYCGGSPDMDRLVELGYMEDLGKPSWCPDNYYAITAKGKDAHAKLNP